MKGLAIVRRKEVSGKIVDTAIHFLFPAVFAGASLFGGYAPFAVGAVAAAGQGRRGMSALLGCASGALLFLNFSHALRTIAAAVLLYTANNAFYDLKVYQKKAFLPLLSAGLMFSVEFVYVVRAGIGEMAYCFLSMLLAALCTHCCRTVLKEEGKEEHPAASMVILLGVLMAFSAFETSSGFAPGRIVAMLAVLFMAFEQERPAAVAGALCIGFAVDLVAGNGSFLHTAAYGLSALAVRFARRGDRVRAALWFVCAVLVFSLPLYAGDGLVLLYEGLAATLCFLLVPTKVFRGKRLAGEKEAQTDEHLLLRQKLEDSAAAFRELYDSLSRVPGCAEENPAVLFDRAAERVCRGCSLCDICWEKEYQRTYTAINDATPALLKNAEAQGKDFPSYFADRCIRFPSFLAAVNSELRDYLLRGQYRKSLSDSRARAAGQYAQVSEVLLAAAGKLNEAHPALAVQPLPYQLGVALRPKKGERVSGDSMSTFETENKLCLLLSDGMGSGEEAKRESAMATRLLERFLRAGIDAPPALKTLNSALTLRAEETGSFTTVDLFLLSLQTGEGELYKYGAAPSYIKRGGTVRRVTCTCLPAGLQECSQPPEATRIRLEGGTFFVMVTDGVADATNDEWLQDLLAGWQGENPQLLVSAILADSIERTGEIDDAGVLVLYLPRTDTPEIKEI